MKSIKMLLATALLLTTPFAAQAEKSKDVGDFVIHYNALTTDFLTAQIAKLYGIKRSKNRGFLNVTVLKKHMGTASLPVKASVEATFINLNNQISTLAPREITNGGAIYYIAEFPISDKDSLDFQIEVTPEGGKTHRFSFRQNFVTK